MNKRSPIGKLQVECDKLMQITGKLKYPKSFISGEPTQVMHHFFPKSVSSFHRYNWDNLIPLTNGEHLRLHHSGDPDYEEVIKQKKGQEWYDRLNATKRNYVKVNAEYYRGVKEKLEQELSTVDTESRIV